MLTHDNMTENMLQGKVDAAIYTRVSSSGQAEKGLSLTAQMKECIKMAKRNGWSYEPFSDKGISDTRVGPNFSFKPTVDPKILRGSSTPSPRRMTVESSSMIWRVASFIASQ